MENNHELYNLPYDKLKADEQPCAFNSVVSCVNKEKEIVDTVTDKSKHSKNNRLTERGKETKSSKITTLLDSYCNSLNESADFVECELTNKFRNASQKSDNKEFQSESQINEAIVCEICKEDITPLDIYYRGIHVNECIDKQISTDSEIPSQSSAGQFFSTSEIPSQSSTNEDAFILECPLCFKHFPSPELRSNHIKKCGKSKGLSLQSILKAIELQERHALERISLGLPAKPVKPVKVPKIPVNKKPIVQPKSKAESDIQLAKALSLSLTNASQQNNEENREQITSVILRPPAANQRPGKKTKKILSRTPPLLVLRSDEDRKKLLLEKVENILTSAIECEQSSLDSNETEVTVDKKSVADQEELTMWYLTSKSSDKCQYYVEELLDWVKPSDVEMGSKLLHLSQIPGHEIVTQLPCDYTFSTSDEKNNADIHTSTVSSIESHYPSSVTESLSLLVASSWMSDVDIHTACGTVIPAHKLLLAIRCPPLKQDFDFCSGKGRASLKWETVAFDAALQFLNFIYTGIIDIRRNLMSDLFYLANKYEVLDLQALLHAKNNDDTMSEMDTNKKILKREDCSPPSSYHTETIGTENVCESQENMDLEIVYNCINSSLKPSQATGTQSSILNDTTPSRCTYESVARINNDIPCKLVDDGECTTVFDCSKETPVCDNNFSPRSNSSVSPMIFDVNDSEGEADNLSLEKTHVTDNFSPKNNRCTSPVIFDVNDSDSEADNHSLEKTPVCDNFTPKKDDCKSPVIFDIDDDETNTGKFSDDETTECILNYSQKPALRPCNIDADVLDLNIVESNTNNLSCNETTECMINYSQKPALGPCIVDGDPLDLNTVESNSSNDSVKFLESNIVHNSSIHNTPEKIQKLTSLSPKCSEMNSFSPKLKNSSQNSPTFYQDRYGKRIMCNGSSTETLRKEFTELKSSPVLCSQASGEKTYDQTPDKCNTPLKNTCVELESPVTLYSQRLLLNFHYNSENKTLNVSKEKNDSKCFNSDLLVNKSLTKESFENVNLIKTEKAPDILFSEEHNRNISKLSSRSSSSHSDPLSGIKSDDNVLLMSPVRNSACPEVVISDSNSDSESQVPCEKSPFHHNFMSFSQNNIKYDINDLNNSSLPSIKNLEADADFDSFHYFNHEISSPGDHLQIVNDSKYAEEKSSSLNESKRQASEGPKITQKEQVPDYSQSSKVPVHLEKEKKGKTATPCYKPEVVQPQFQFSDSPVTPLPDYKSMMTPEIKQALKRIGVKALPRKKAVAILSHVYNETHPLIDAETNEERRSDPSEIPSNKVEKTIKSKKRKQNTQNIEKPVKKQQKENNSEKVLLASPESDESSSENPEWLGCVPEMSFSQSNHDSPTKPSDDVIETVKHFIKSSEELYHNVLNYIPLNLVEFHQELKKKGVKISIQKLMDFLDEQCITFTCPRKEEYKKKQTARAQRFRKNMIAKLSQQAG